MARIEELTNEVRQLSREELAAFRDWFRKYDSDEWDREIGNKGDAPQFMGIRGTPLNL
jgi:hypothetical protein